MFPILKIRKRSLLVASISIATLLCLLFGIFVYSNWLQREIGEVVQRQVIDDNIQTARQLTRLVHEMDIDDIQRDPASWDRLQSIVEEIRLPNDGFVCVVNAASGNLICHPKLRDKPEMRNMPAGKSQIQTDGWEGPIVHAWSNGEDTVIGGLAKIKDEVHVLAAGRLPKHSANIMVHQKASGIEKTVSQIIAPVRILGCATAVLITALLSLINFMIVRCYENKLACINEGLEQTVRDRTRSLRKTKNAVIFGLAKLSESRDTDTGEHLERIRIYVDLLVKHLQRIGYPLNSEMAEELPLASSLHDIGKVGIPDQVLLKPGRFTPEERAVMERHSKIGGDCLNALRKQLGEDDFLLLATEIAYFHHERWDGTGYPAKLTETDIPVSARIVALADVYDALTSKRPYKDAMSHEKARKIILKGRGIHFDPDVVDAFLIVEEQFREIAETKNEASVLTSIQQMTEELISFNDHPSESREKAPV